MWIRGSMPLTNDADPGPASFFIEGSGSGSATQTGGNVFLRCGVGCGAGNRGEARLRKGEGL
jgi:hypothetical protein